MEEFLSYLIKKSIIHNLDLNSCFFLYMTKLKKVNIIFQANWLLYLTSGNS